MKRQTNLNFLICQTKPNNRLTGPFLTSASFPKIDIDFVMYWKKKQTKNKHFCGKEFASVILSVSSQNSRYTTFSQSRHVKGVVCSVIIWLVAIIWTSRSREQQKTAKILIAPYANKTLHNIATEYTQQHEK